MNRVEKLKNRYFYGISVKLFVIVKVMIGVFLILSFYPGITKIHIAGRSINFVPIVGIVFVLILSYSYNKMLAKPLIEINEIVSRIAKLDFSTECSITSNDELGELSKNLNLVSNKLNTTIGDLETEVNNKKELLQLHKELTDTLAHEIKTPLGIVKAYTEALEDNINPEKQDKYIKTIIFEIDRLNNLIVELLDLSSIEAGTVELNKERLDIIELIEEIAGRILIDISEKTFKVVCDFENHPIFINGDRAKLEKAISNLISNAYKYVTHSGMIKITIKQSFNKARVEIYNTSNGIPEDKIPLIWEKFYRLDTSRDKKTGGSGIGLAVTGQIFKLHNFMYGVKNQGNGVVFYFEV